MRVCVLFGNDFEEIETITLIDILRRGGIEVDIFGVGAIELRGRSGIVIKTEFIYEKFSDINVLLYEALILPGGPGILKINENIEVILKIEEFYKKDKYIFAVCAAPLLLEHAKILTERRFTCYPGTSSLIKTGTRIDEKVVVDGKIITSQGVGTSIDAALKLLEIFSTRENSKKIAESIVYKF